MHKQYSINGVTMTRRGGIAANLLENGIVIAKISRPPITNFIHEFQVKFLSSASKVRFETFCGEISCSETIEAMLG